MIQTCRYCQLSLKAELHWNDFISLLSYFFLHVPIKILHARSTPIKLFSSSSSLSDIALIVKYNEDIFPFFFWLPNIPSITTHRLTLTLSHHNDWSIYNFILTPLSIFNLILLFLFTSWNKYLGEQLTHLGVIVFIITHFSNT